MMTSSRWILSNRCLAPSATVPQPISHCHKEFIDKFFGVDKVFCGLVFVSTTAAWSCAIAPIKNKKITLNINQT